jgi:arylsulfatase A-like enzyme
MKEKYPNILIIVLDAVRFDFTSLSNPNIRNTPFLSELAKARKIFNFSSTYSTYDSTNLSHFSLMSGFITTYQAILDMPQFSLPYQLKTLGYETIGISANGNLSPKTMASFIAFDKFVNLHEIWESFSQEEKDEISKTLDKKILTYGGETNDINRVAAFRSGNKVITLFKDYMKDSAHPFFGFINLVDAHDPYFPVERYYNIDKEEAHLKKKVNGDLRSRELSNDQINPDSIKDEIKRQIVKNRLEIAQGRNWCLSDDLSEEAIEIYRRRYAAKIKELDDYVRQIFETLEKKDLLSSTIIFITADHGESFGENGFITHSLDNQGDRESTHRVPLAMYCPKKYGLKGIKLSVLASIADIPPTIYDLLRVNWFPLANMGFVGNYGKSLVPYIVCPFEAKYDKELALGKSAPIDPGENEKRKNEALKRLRSLGYIK